MVVNEPVLKRTIVLLANDANPVQMLPVDTNWFTPFKSPIAAPLPAAPPFTDRIRLSEIRTCNDEVVVDDNVNGTIVAGETSTLKTLARICMLLRTSWPRNAPPTLVAELTTTTFPIRIVASVRVATHAPPLVTVLKARTWCVARFALRPAMLSDSEPCDWWSS